MKIRNEDILTYPQMSQMIGFPLYRYLGKYLRLKYILKMYIGTPYSKLCHTTARKVIRLCQL